ncbi:DUF4843 domain-containing protein [Paraflavitalea pollutisoli]|uniref:DUF4843 domain-containing protein n=1 Tax=Paraflavitalea pollutisoli TaxID=3034143 RepID=UPI0023EA832A|nr:DUF4843 domain-containing protein [Paraflavitalea sp. H1-2-19X]
MLSCLLLAALSGCSKDLKTYDGSPTIYFIPAVEAPPTNTQAPLFDSTIVTFAYVKAEQKDSILRVPVKVSGPVSPVDRTYALKVQDTSSGQVGVHYDFVKPFIIKAGKTIDTIYLLLHRTPDMLLKTFSINLELQANEHFDLGLPWKKYSTYLLSTIVHRVKVDDILSTPKYWLAAYLGDFSRRKLYLMCDLLEIPIDKLNTSVSVAETVFYGKFMQRYLNEQRALGNTIKEENGNDMVMGALSQ